VIKAIAFLKEVIKLLPNIDLTPTTSKKGTGSMPKQLIGIITKVVKIYPLFGGETSLSSFSLCPLTICVELLIHPQKA